MNMSLIKFTSLALGFLFTLQALKQHPLVYAHRGGDADRKNLVHNPEDTSRMWYKELHHHLHVGGPRKLRLGGRKKTSKEGNNENSFEISGEQRKTKKFQDHVNIKKNYASGYVKNQNSTKPSEFKPSFSRRVSRPELLYEGYRAIEMPKLLKEMKKIARSLRNDYSSHTNTPRRKPPVNNRVPTQN